MNDVDETQNWCNGMGCAEHQQTKATLYIRYKVTEDEEGNQVTKPVSAYLKGETRTWTDLLFAGFHATSQVKMFPTYFQTPQFRFGVDGKAIPSPVGSDRTDQWTVDVPLATALADRRIKGGVMDVDFYRG